jgi:hypothetical protein
VLLVSNTSDRAFIGADGLSLRVPLPPNAAGLQFEGSALGEQYVSTPDGFADTQAIIPGSMSAQLVFSFRLLFDGNSLELALPVAYATQTINVLVPASGFTLTSDQLAAAGMRETANGTFLTFNSLAALAAGQTLRLRLSSAAGSTAASASVPWLEIGLALAGVAALGGLGLWWRARPPARTKDELLDAIAALDDAYAAGQISAAEYDRERAALKAELVNLL